MPGPGGTPLPRRPAVQVGHPGFGTRTSGEKIVRKFQFRLLDSASNQRDIASIHLAPCSATPYTHLPEAADKRLVERHPHVQGAPPMAATIPVQNSDLEFNNGTFDSAAFTAKTLANWQSLAAVIDHTLLNPDATRQQVESLCEEAVRYRFACVMVNPVWASTAVSLLAGTGIHVGVPIGFPLGASLVSTLRQEAAALSSAWALASSIWSCPSASSRAATTRPCTTPSRAAVIVAHHHGALLKVILETCLLTVEEKLRASEIAIQAGADFIKTSTGFSTRRRNRSRCSSAARGGRRPLRHQGLRRHPHSRGRPRPARSRRQPHRLVSLGGDCARAGRRVTKTGNRE